MSRAEGQLKVGIWQWIVAAKKPLVYPISILPSGRIDSP